MKRPANLPFWIGDTAYLKHTSQTGTVVAVIFEGSPDQPIVRYDIRWTDDDKTRREHYAIELSAEKNFP